MDESYECFHLSVCSTAFLLAFPRVISLTVPSFAPITIVSGIWGMNVSQISGTTQNPSIWQPFVAVAGLNIVAFLVLAMSQWIQIQLKHGRAAGVKEIAGFAVGSLTVGPK